MERERETDRFVQLDNRKTHTGICVYIKMGLIRVFTMSAQRIQFENG